jgi:hypothetical protein
MIILKEFPYGIMRYSFVLYCTYHRAAMTLIDDNTYGKYVITVIESESLGLTTHLIYSHRQC